MSWWLGISASCGTSRNVGINCRVQRTISPCSNERALLTRLGGFRKDLTIGIEQKITLATMKQKIYLCGPIMDEHEGHARAWRDMAKKHLGHDFTLLDPMRRNFKDREVDSANEIV